ncbi:MAG: YfcE family phosphodiesterase [Phycisphaerales bacterium]|nr:MAG: YfcE family phosphodiesterase [Phycisphaerales bacterium]
MARKKTQTTIALISDIHGNLPALEAVLEDAARHEIDQIWNLGDMLGYAPFPNEVLQKLQEVGAVNLIGNYDRKVLAFQDKREKWKHKKSQAKYLGFRWNDAQLLESHRVFLESLPEQARRRVNGLETLLVHGSPASIDELLNSDTPEARFEELAEMAQADIVVCGHSHEPFVQRVGEISFVNPGSVGRPEGDDGRASYALLAFGDGAMKVGHRRVAYDIERVVRAIHAAGLPADYVEVFRQAKSLDQLWHEAKGARRPGRGKSQKVLEAALALATRCRYEREHTHQVTRLALELFDQLRDLHQLGAGDRFWLECGALLHDIGWTEGQQGHHKTALRLIVADPRLPLERREREIVGLIARYHRKSLPSEQHKHYGNLHPSDQHRVAVLGGILRLADGLDRTHASVVQRLACKVSPRKITIDCQVREPADIEFMAAKKKADLLESVFRRTVTIGPRRKAT